MGSRFANQGGVHPVEEARLLSPVLWDLWPARATSRFANLLRAIDEAVVRQRCVSRLRRVHRMLARL